jgi:hypothetical protein
MDSDKFDFDNIHSPDEQTIRRVANEMAGGGLPPLTADELADRARWREELHQRDEQDRIIRERATAEATAEAERQVRMRRELAYRQSVADAKAKVAHQRPDSDLRRRMDTHENWQRQVEQAALKAEQHQRLQARLALIDEWSPKPPPEPRVVVVEADDAPADRRWFQR